MSPFSEDSCDKRSQTFGNAEGVLTITLTHGIFMVLNTVGVAEVDMVNSAVVIGWSITVLITENLNYLFLCTLQYISQLARTLFLRLHYLHFNFLYLFYY